MPERQMSQLLAIFYHNIEMNLPLTKSISKLSRQHDGNDHTHPKPTITALILVSIIILLSSFNLASQSQQTDQPAFRIKSAIILRILEYTNWPNQSELKQIKIAHIGDNSDILTELSIISTRFKIGQLPFSITQESLESLNPNNYQVVFLHQSKKDLISPLANKTRRTDTLLISDEAPRRHDVMVNFLAIVNKVVDFELNRSNIVFEKLQVDRDLFLFGGSEIDVAELFREAEGSLNQIKQELFDNRQALLNKQQLLEQTSASLNEKQQQIDTFKQELTVQQQQLAKRAAQLDKLNTNVEQASLILMQNRQQLQSQEKQLQDQEKHNQQLDKNLQDQGVKVAYLNEQIAEKQAFLATQQQHLETLKGRNDQQQGTINGHKRTIIGGLVAVVLLLAVMLYILKINRSRKRSHHLLHQAQANLVSIGTIGREFTCDLELDALLKQIENSFARLINPHTLILGIVNQQQLNIPLYCLEQQQQPAKQLDLKQAKHPLIWCIEQQKDIVCNDVSCYHIDLALNDNDKHLKTIICQPLIIAKQSIGVLSIQSPQPNAFSDVQLDMFRILSQYIALALANTLGFEKLHTQKLLSETPIQDVQIAK